MLYLCLVFYTMFYLHWMTLHYRHLSEASVEASNRANKNKIHPYITHTGQYFIPTPTLLQDHWFFF